MHQPAGAPDQTVIVTIGNTAQTITLAFVNTAIPGSAVPAALAAKGVTEADLCTLGGAQFDNKGQGTFAGSVSIAQ